jgi:penicillin-binding protein 3
LKKLTGILLILLVIAIAGCSKEPMPQDRFSEYIALWNQQKFDKMYDYLSNSAKKNITKKEFTSRYQKIYKDLEITDLKIDFKKPKVDKKKKAGDKVAYTFSAKMNSMAGIIQFTHKAQLKKEEQDKKNNWYVDWDTNFIFPQLQKGDKIGVTTIDPERGTILDRNGSVMAVNGQAYEVGVIAGKMNDQITQKLAALLKITPDQIKMALSANWVKPDLFVPLKKVSMDDHKLVNQLTQLDPVRTKKVGARVYPYSAAAAQLIGYVGPITADELKEHKGYTAQDLIGKRGLEQVYDEQLKGKTGVRITITKKLGGLEVLAEKPVEDGKQLQLTIDADLQVKLFKTMTGESGASAAMNPITGETLALVSSPSFDPNKAALGFTTDEWKALQENKQQPLSTRFKQTYAPGSVLKPLTASIALARGAITPEQSIVISGKKWQKGKSWGNYFVTRVHQASPINLEKALVYSDNIYFAQAALKMGKDKFVEGMKKFGFEEKLAYPFPLQTSKIGSLGSEIALADSGYGQGQVQMNIVHLMSTYTPFVNNGNMIKPILLLNEKKGQVWKQQVVSTANAAIVSGILSKVVSDPKGTAHAANIPGYPLAGKTGTAEIKQKQGETGTENGWFIAYNTKTPNLLIAMMIENVQNRGGSMVPVKKVKNLFMSVK